MCLCAMLVVVVVCTYYYHGQTSCYLLGRQDLLSLPPTAGENEIFMWVSLLESSALVVQLRLLMATAVVLYGTTETVFHNALPLWPHTGELCPHL